MNIYQMLYRVTGAYTNALLAAAAVVLLLVLCVYGFRYYQKAITQIEETRSHEFGKFIMELKKDMTENDFDRFYEFLRNYPGGTTCRRKGKIVAQVLSNFEKADLKTFFERTVVPASHVSVNKKESLREHLRTRKIYGLDQMPDYPKPSPAAADTCGEFPQLPPEDFSVLSNVTLKLQDRTQTYRYIIVGMTGIFFVEDLLPENVKSQPDGKMILNISKTNTWSLRLEKDGQEALEQPLKNPTGQIIGKKLLLENILKEYLLQVHPLVILGKLEVEIRQQCDLSFTLLSHSQVAEQVKNHTEVFNENDRLMALQLIREHRLY